jgi:hypothetical protein
MTIYRSNRTPAKLYRKIYEDNVGPIPRESNGRSYEIHHIDGDDTNNDLNNLIAVSLQEHYNIHYQQGDYKACAIIAGKLKYSPEQISNLIRLASKKQVENGTHPWLGERNPIHKKIADETAHLLNSDWQKEKSRKQVENGTHSFLGGEVQRKRIDNGTHHFLGESNPSIKKVKDGTHHLLGGSIQRETNRRLLAEGTHSTQWKWKCECGKEGKGKSNLSQHQRSLKCSLNAKN